jgi:hypothetical protein
MLGAAFAMAQVFDRFLVEPSDVRLGTGGAVEAWVVAGPFPNEPDENGHAVGLSTQWIGSEAAARPIEGRFITHLRDAGIPDFWRLAATNARHELDFGKMLNGSSPGVAYAFTTLITAHSGPATLLIEGANVLRVLVDGKQVFQGGKLGAASARVSVTLQKGANAVLVKAVHDSGEWSAKLSVVSRTGIYERLEVYRTGAHAEPADLRAVRAVRGKAGSLDLDAAVAYDSTTRYAAQWIDIFQPEVDRPKILQRIIGEAGRFVVTAERHDADQISVALKRATDLIRVALDHARTRVIASFQHPKPLMRVNVSKEDFARVGPGRRYFVHSNGKPLPIVGFTQPLTSGDTFACDPNNGAYDPDRTDAYFARVADSGVNVVRIAIDSPETDPFQYKTGEISPEHMKWIDNIFLIALKHGLKLLVSAYDSPRDSPQTMGKRFLTTAAGQNAQKRRWRAVIDRWGNSGAVFGWEILDEGDEWRASASELANDISTVAGFVRRYERIRWGRNHLVTSSTYAAVPSGALGDVAFHNKALDFAETHLYAGSSRAPLDPWSPARDVTSSLVQCIAETKNAMPYLDGENGPLDRPVADALFDGEIFDSTAWSEFTAGSSGVGLRRPYRNPDSLTDEMLGTLLSIRLFSIGVDWAKLSGAGSNNLTTEIPRRWTCSGFGTRKSAVLWAGGPVLGDRIVLDSRSPIRSGSFRAYDCDGKKWVGEGSFSGSLIIPEGLKSVAWVLNSK